MARPMQETSPKGKKDHRYFADAVKCPICGAVFRDDSVVPEDTEDDMTAHLKSLLHHSEEHPDREFKGAIPLGETRVKQE